MKISERIKENENSKINALLVAHGFERIKVEDAPFSQFYAKEINENQTQYIRKDIDTYRNKTVFQYESWIRHDDKDVFDEDFDTDRIKYVSIQSVEKLENLIKEI